MTWSIFLMYAIVLVCGLYDLYLCWEYYHDPERADLDHTGNIDSIVMVNMLGSVMLLGLLYP